MDELIIEGFGRIGEESIIQGTVVVIRDLGKGRYHMRQVAGGEAAKALQARRLGSRSRRNRPGRPPIRSDD